MFFISSGILRNVWEIFSRATSSSWMCRIIVVLFQSSLHVTGLSSYFKTSHKESVDSVRTMLKLASPKCWDKNLWPQHSKCSSLACSCFFTKGHIVFPLQCGPVSHRMLSVFKFLTLFLTHLSVQYTIDLTAVCLIVMCIHQPSDDRETWGGSNGFEIGIQWN